MEKQASGEILIYVPEASAGRQDLPSDEAVVHSLPDVFRRVVKVPTDKIQEQWKQTLDTLMGLSSTIAQESSNWTVDEIEVGLTLSAKGELLFIAEAGAEASIKFILRPKA